MKILISLIVTLLLGYGFIAEDGVSVNDSAPGFTLKNINGSYMSLSDFDDKKGVILIFTCNTCPFVVKYEDRIIALDMKYKEMGYPVIAINPNDVNIKPGDSYDEMIIRAEEKEFTFPYLYDESQEVASAYGATRTPHVYLLENTENGFKVAYIGTIDDNVESPDEVQKKYVEDAILALENGDLPNPDFTKAIGCTIKWRTSD